jgi:ketosteroid isomerase-like protein
MITDTEKTALAQEFLAGLKTRDWDRLRAVMTDDIVWTMPGGSLISGEAQGVDAVLARSQQIVGYGLDFELKHILIGRHHVALSLHNTATRDGLQLDEYLATVCFLRDGKIAAIHSFLSDIGGMNAFFV